jgi:hypothetical protein
MAPYWHRSRRVPWRTHAYFRALVSDHEPFSILHTVPCYTLHTCIVFLCILPTFTFVHSRGSEIGIAPVYIDRIYASNNNMFLQALLGARMTIVNGSPIVRPDGEEHRSAHENQTKSTSRGQWSQGPRCGIRSRMYGQALLRRTRRVQCNTVQGQCQRSLQYKVWEGTNLYQYLVEGDTWRGVVRNTDLSIYDSHIDPAIAARS